MGKARFRLFFENRMSQGVLLIREVWKERILYCFIPYII